MNAAKNDTSLEGGSCIDNGEKSMRFHFLEYIVPNDEKSDAFITISCMDC